MKEAFGHRRLAKRWQTLGPALAVLRHPVDAFVPQPVDVTDLSDSGVGLTLGLDLCVHPGDLLILDLPGRAGQPLSRWVELRWLADHGLFRTAGCRFVPAPDVPPRPRQDG
jgi:hypothetical protein